MKKSILSLAEIGAHLDLTDMWTEADVATINGNVGLSAFEARIEAGYTYWYQLELMVQNATGGTLSLTTGHFSVSGDAAASSHKRTRMSAALGATLSDSSLTTSPTSVAIAASTIRDVRLAGVIVCTTSGLITPQLGATGVMTSLAGAAFRLRRKVTLV